MALISISLLAADFARLGEDLETMKGAGVKMVHIDVCDGHFAPGVTVGLPVIASLRKNTGLLLDVHLRVERPERFVEDFIEAGADRLAVHAESTPDVCRALRAVRLKGVQAGVALNPATPLEAVSGILDEVDFLNLCETEGQPYSARAIHKVNMAAKARCKEGVRFALQVEGGIDPHHIGRLAEAGADVIVAGAETIRGAGLKTILKELIRSASEAEEKISSAGVITGSEQR